MNFKYLQSKFKMLTVAMIAVVASSAVQEEKLQA